MKVTGIDNTAVEMEVIRKATQERRAAENEKRNLEVVEARRETEREVVRTELDRAREIKDQRERDLQDKKIAEKIEERNTERSRETVKENDKPVEKSGKYLDYTLNSDNELVIRVREGYNGKEIRQIPSKAAQAARRGFRKVMDILFDDFV